MKNKKLPAHVAIGIVTILVASISLVEWRALYALDHPPQHKINCISCHSDAKTLKAMAAKADDPLYAVHQGYALSADSKYTSNASSKKW